MMKGQHENTDKTISKVALNYRSGKITKDFPSENNRAQHSVNAG